MWGSSSTSGLPFQFQSTYLISSSSLLRPVLQFQSTYLISSSSLLRPVLQFQSTSSQDQPRMWGFFPVVPLHLQAMQVLLDWLIFVGSSLYKDSSSLQLVIMAVTSLKCIGFFICVCVCISIDSVFFVECFFEMLFFYFELYSQYSNKLLSVFKELLVIIRFLNDN